jgi:membrane-associated protease RseP (regulator of RpoE activity)
MSHPPRWLNLVLFLSTLLSTFLAGALFFHAETLWEQARNGLVFMAALMGILVCHEAGHYVMARRNRVEASLPFFVPMPPIFPVGTFGALIFMRGRIRSRAALLEVGAAGPLCGMAVALPVLLVGLNTCPVGPVPQGGFMEGQSLLYLAAKWLAAGPIPPGHDVYVDRSPLVWAGWLGMLVTMINLLPIGQLDGGHVAYALFGERHRLLSRLFLGGLFALGAVVMLHYGLGAWRAGLHGEELVARAMVGFNWIFWGGLLVLLRRRVLGHPPTDDQHLPAKHRAAGWLCILLFAVTFMPYLMRPL